MAEYDIKELRLQQDRLHRMELATCATDFRYFSQFLVTDDEEMQKQRVFPDLEQFPHVKKIHDAYEGGDRIVVLKPRRMQTSMYLCARKLWKAKFAGTGLPGTEDVFHGGYSATDESLAFYQLSRISAMHARLPEHIRNFNPLVKDNTLFKVFEKGGKVEGFPLRRQGPQGFGFSEFDFDEAAWQEAAASTYRGLAPTIGRGKICIVSTPNGEEGIGQFFCSLWHGTNGRYQNYNRVEFDWWDNPEHDQAWFDRVTADLEEWEVAQMYLKSFVTVEGEPVFPEFRAANHVSTKPLQFIPGRTVYICWDFGFYHPACVFMQQDQFDRWMVLREFCPERLDFSLFAKFILEKANTFYDRTDQKNWSEIHFIDPAGFQRYADRSMSGATCAAHEIRERFKYSDDFFAQVRSGAMQVGDRKYEGPRLRAVRELFRLRDDKKYGIIIDPGCTTIIDGFAGGYVLDKFGVPVKNKYSHPMDAIQYGVTGYNMVVNPSKYQKAAEKSQYKRIGHRTGR